MRSKTRALAMRAASIIALTLALNACVDQTGPSMGHHGHAAHGKDFPLFDNLGTHEHKISTKSQKAQAYFNQGYRYLFNFNHAGAIASFQTALAEDDHCAMCWWGIAFAHGPNINMPMMPDAHAPALHALEKAKHFAHHASPAERDYINALATRYDADPAADRAKLDRAFMLAMRKLARKYPRDLDAQVLYAEALMDTSPWDYWRADRVTPKKGMEDLVPQIERVLRQAPNHPGAIHLYIHAVEATLNPGRAEKHADRLRTLMPGAGHLVHMPTHIYNRIGRYEDGVTWNQKAASADENYFAATRDRGMYAAMYYVHNLHFVWTAASSDGRSSLAQDYAKRVVANVQPAMAKDVPGIQAFVPTELYALLRFGKWNEVLRARAPSSDLHFATAIWHYARARAAANVGDLKLAESEAAQIATSFSEVDAEQFKNFGVPGAGLVRIAHLVAQSEIARANKDSATAIKLLREAVKEQDQLSYTEPPWWDFPVRQHLGAELLAAGRAREAESVYREDLREWPKNGWSLLGLSQALQAQGKTREAAQVASQFKATWARADVQLTSSRF